MFEFPPEQEGTLSVCTLLSLVSPFAVSWITSAQVPEDGR